MARGVSGVAGKPRILMVTDSDGEAAVLTREIQSSGLDVSAFRVDTPAALKESLARETWDIVVADYEAARFGGTDVVAQVHAFDPEMPVIVVSARGGEESAVAVMKAGATDYVTKSNIMRLGQVIRRELREEDDRRARRKAEEALRRTSEELTEAQRELVQAEKLAALGRFSSGVAHEVKNPLGIILGGVEFLELKLAEADSEVRTALAKIKEAALRAAAIVDQVLKFARPSPLDLETADVNEFVEETVDLFHLAVPTRRIEMEVSYAPGPLRVRVDKNQLQQVVFNLLVNAVDAMPGGGRIRVCVGEVSAGDVFRDPSCVIEVADNGEGIPRKSMKKLFEPFFTTKRDRKGTGLGLFVARTIVERHGGVLKIESEPGRGTSAKVFLPAAKGG